jgi:hypothetical protein
MAAWTMPVPPSAIPTASLRHECPLGVTETASPADPRQYERSKAVDTPEALFSACTVEVVERVF